MIDEGSRPFVISLGKLLDNSIHVIVYRFVVDIIDAVEVFKQ